ncbi:MAG: alkene reductase [Vulcanimicrobiaceae bacterium]
MPSPINDSSAKLFEPITIGRLALANRVFMAPLTRSRANATDDAPVAMNVEYYAQRASAGLIIAEATQISPQGKGYAFTPGIYSEAQVAGWKRVTDAVHAEGGKIVLQLWHVGRVSHPTLQPDGGLPVAPAALAFASKVYNNDGFVDCVTPRALEASELPGIVDDYKRAARHAIAAGFDGVEVHSANGYLLDEFLRDSSNKRTDEYGGSVENRTRFPLAVIAGVIAEIGADRVGVRISPVTPFGDVSDSAAADTFGTYVDSLNALGIAFLHVIEGATGGPRDFENFDYADLRRRFAGPYVANNGYDRALAIDAVASGRADAVAFGRLYIANPDLVERLRENAPLNAPIEDAFYGGDARGYIDYPVLAAAPARV